MHRSDTFLVRDSAQCIACNKKRDILKDLPLCEACALELLRSGTHEMPLCKKCLSLSRKGKPCSVCNQDKDHLITQTYAPYIYKGVPRKLVHVLKFKYETRACALLAARMTPALNGMPFDLVVPIPLHPLRMKERGYNQALLLAYPVSKQLDIPLKEVLVRSKYTRRQSSILNFKDRKKNVQDAFTLSPSEDVNNMHILLVDDVRTTGETARQCAKVLIEKGASSVSLLVACVAVGAGRHFKKT